MNKHRQDSLVRPQATSTREQTALEWLANLGYHIEYGPEIAFDGLPQERNAKARDVANNWLAEQIVGGETKTTKSSFTALPMAIRKLK